MADNRTGLSAADIAEQFRDMCGDGSVEWVTGPMQTWLLLDAADMLDEFADTPKCETCEAMLDCDECLRADASQKERRRLDYENAKLRELVQKFAEYVSQDRCLGCVVKSRCCDGEVDECWLLTEIRNEAHELGIEVCDG